MTNKFKIISEDGLKTLCKAIKKTSTIGEILDDANSTTDKTYSSFEIDRRLNTKIDKTQLTTVLDETVTDEQVASAKVVYDKVKDSNIKTYTALEQLGLTSGCTVQEVYIALPTPSTFVAKTINTDITDIPTTRGIIIVHKPIAGFVEVTFKETAIAGVSPNNMWLGSLKGGDGTGLTWSKVCATKVADVPFTPITFKDSNIVSLGNSGYCVNNGWCHLVLEIQFNADMTFGWNGITNCNIPIPKTSLRTTKMILNSTTAPVKSIVCGVQGELVLFGSASNTEQYFGSVSFPVAE